MSRYRPISLPDRRNAKLALFTCVLAFVVILLGAYTRLTDAGLSCPDWPNCYGYLTAPHTEQQIQDAASRYPNAAVNTKKAWTEMTHRYFAGTEGILILILSFTLIRNRKHILAAAALIVLLCSQVLLGMLTVTAKLKPIIVLGHLLNGLSLLAILWWLFLNLREHTTATFARLIPWLWLGFGILALQITLGGWVSTHYAGLACIDFPYCNGQLLPAMQWQALNTDLITIHMLHRIGAFITAIYLSGIACVLLRQQTTKNLGLWLFSLIALQVTLGILNIIWLRPVWLALTHHAVAILLLLTMIFILAKAYHSQDS